MNNITDKPISDADESREARKRRLKREQRRRYRQRHPDKVKEERKRYLERKLIKEYQDNPNLVNRFEKKLLKEFDKYTKLMFDDKLPNHCELCGALYSLHIHHMQYIFPIEKKHLIRLCHRCHVEEHQKIHPLTSRECVPNLSHGE